MEHSKTDKPVLTALDILQFRNLQKQLLQQVGAEHGGITIQNRDLLPIVNVQDCNLFLMISFFKEALQKYVAR